MQTLTVPLVQAISEPTALSLELMGLKLKRKAFKRSGVSPIATNRRIAQLSERVKKLNG